ncbi:MAG: glycosyltransferase family 39 protein [Chitinophagales bacterium]|nr:glycosyltransferase family 39 protein [Chitinophagales bacterium]
MAGAAYFIPFLGAAPLFDWDEINFAESAREMLVTGDFITVQIDYQPFWEKPPLFFWLQAVSMTLFGVNEFAARFPNAVFGMLTLLLFFFLGKKLHNTRLAVIWVFSMAGSFLPALYFKSGIIDPVFNFFIFFGVVCLAASIHHVGNRLSLHYAVLSGVFIGLATLTKGPVALLVFLLTAFVYWLAIHRRKIYTWPHVLRFAVSYSVVAGIWFGLDVYRNGIDFLFEFIIYQWDLLTTPVAGHSGPFYYHFVVILFGCFPMSVVGIPLLFQRRHISEPWDFSRWMQILFWVVLILFSLVKTKILHYSSLAYFPLSYLAARYIERMAGPAGMPVWQRMLLAVIGILIAAMLFAAPWLAQRPELIMPFVKDPFAADCLTTNVSWDGWESWIGMAYLLCVGFTLLFILRKNITNGLLFLYASTALCLFLYLKAVIPRIAGYSQGPAIAFYKSLQGEKVYVNPYGFKSYAQYFYFQKPPGDPAESRDLRWLVSGAIDRPAYFVAKTTTAAELEGKTDMLLLGKEGGYVFFMRQPPQSNPDAATPNIP